MQLARANRRWRTRDDDGGQLMLLAGIIITISFILTSLTLAQVGALEREAASMRKSGMTEEWRFLHNRLATNFVVAVSPDLSNSSFENVTFPTIVATFRSIEAEKGYDAVIRLAGASAAVNKTEESLLYNATNVKGANYTKWDGAGTYFFNRSWDGKNDGIIWERPCPNDDGPAGGCIAGVLVYVHLTDGTSTMEEVLLIHVNRND